MKYKLASICSAFSSHSYVIITNTHVDLVRHVPTLKHYKNKLLMVFKLCHFYFIFPFSTFFFPFSALFYLSNHFYTHISRLLCTIYITYMFWFVPFCFLFIFALKENISMCRFVLSLLRFSLERLNAAFFCLLS